MFLRGGGVCTQAMFYKTHSSQELRTQPHRTNSIATLTTSGLTKFSLFPSSRAPRRFLAPRARLYSPLTGRQNFHGRKFTKRDLTSYRLASHVFLSFRASTRLGGQLFHDLRISSCKKPGTNTAVFFSITAS